MDHHRLPRQALTWEHKGFRRRPGRPRQNWKDVVKKDLRKTLRASAGTRLKRLRRTGGARRIVSPNASLTRDEPGTIAGVIKMITNSYHQPKTRKKKKQVKRRQCVLVTVLRLSPVNAAACRQCPGSLSPSLHLYHHHHHHHHHYCYCYYNDDHSFIFLFVVSVKLLFQCPRHLQYRGRGNKKLVKEM